MSSPTASTASASRAGAPLQLRQEPLPETHGREREGDRDDRQAEAGEDVFAERGHPVALPPALPPALPGSPAPQPAGSSGPVTRKTSIRPVRASGSSAGSVRAQTLSGEAKASAGIVEVEARGGDHVVVVAVVDSGAPLLAARDRRRSRRPRQGGRCTGRDCRPRGRRGRTAGRRRWSLRPRSARRRPRLPSGRLSRGGSGRCRV